MYHTTSFLNNYNLSTKYIPIWRDKELKVINTLFLNNPNKVNTLFIISSPFFSLFLNFFLFLILIFHKELAKGNLISTENSNSSLIFGQQDNGFLIWIQEYTSLHQKTKSSNKIVMHCTSSQLKLGTQEWNAPLVLAYGWDNHWPKAMVGGSNQ